MHNYIVKNDEKANYVEFNVSIPDGYNSFKVDYINGSIINQNYLNVGDRIVFKFNNNPLRYDVPEAKVNMLIKDTSDNNLHYVTDEHTYKFINANLMNYYKLIFIPIYTYYTPSGFVYIFNPCDNSASNFMNEPLRNIPGYVFKESIQPINDGSDNITYENFSDVAEFTGNYVLALVPTDGNKISDIMLTVGESINNSKMRPQDAGSFQISASTINEVNTTSLQKESYNYGSTWNYPVHNLIMNHKQSINVTDITANMQLMKFFKYDGSEDPSETHYKTVFYDLNTKITNNTGEYTTSSGSKFQLYQWDENQVINITNIIKPINNVKVYAIPLFHKHNNNDNNTMYRLIDKEEEAIIKQTISTYNYTDNDITGNNLCNASAAFFSITNPFTMPLADVATLQEINTTNYPWMYNDAHYSYKITKIYIKFLRKPNNNNGWQSINKQQGRNYDYIILCKPGTNELPEKGKAYLYNCDYAYSFRYCEDADGNNQRDVGRDLTFQIKYPGTNEWIEPSGEDFSIYLCGVLHYDDNGVANVICQMSSGIYPATSVYIYNAEISGNISSLQLTDSEYTSEANPVTNNAKRCSCMDDILVNAVKDETKKVDGIELSMNMLKNTIINYNFNGETHIQRVENTIMEWYNDPSEGTRVHTPLECFVPLKTTRALTPYYKRNGFFIINDLNGNNTTNLTDSDCEVYLSTGHETLNIEPENKDDDKFKTFNGSLLFDRSDSRITRLFSNDVTGSCLGYLNDLLSAKLSRYYTCVNYNAWNTFINNNRDVTLSLDSKTCYAVFQSGDVMNYNHEYVLASCFDICKVIGSETVVNNCIPNLSIEQQQYRCLIKSRDNFKTTPEFNPDTPLNTYYYKFFHYYNSALDTYPYIGLSTSDMYNGSTTIGGLSGNTVYKDSYMCAEDKQQSTLHNNQTSMLKHIYVANPAKAKLKYSNIYNNDSLKMRYYDTNKYLSTYGVGTVVPTFRIYRNSNFEQSDLTITTGGIKTIHPIYLQSTPRILLHNVMYLLDFVINKLMNTRGKIYDTATNTGGFYVNTMTTNASFKSLYDTVADKSIKYPLIHLPINNYNEENAVYYPSDITALLLLNYCNGSVRSINDYYDANAVAEALPALDSKDNTKNNEEIIQDIIIDDESTCVQLFSNKFFKFYDNVDIFNVVTFKQQYVDSVYYNNTLLGYYYDIEELSNSALTSLTNSIDSLINNVESYNNLKLCKIFICKLGEFLDYPKILFGAVDTFMNSLRVSVNSVQTIDSALPVKQYARDLNNPVNGKYDENAYTVFDSKLNDYNKDDNKRNTYMFGVIFKYHQLALGYQNLSNELSDDYNISKANGQRHFKLILYDEYGRRIPNTDTSQGFKNNLMLELTLA